VAGYKVTTNLDGSLQLSWSVVNTNENGTPASDISFYRVRRSNFLLGPFTTVVAEPSVTEINLPAITFETYFQVLAVDTFGNESPPAVSNLLRVTPANIVSVVGVATDNTQSHVSVPMTLLGELRSPTDHLVSVKRNTDPAYNKDVTRTLATYDVQYVSPNMAVDKDFLFSQPAVTVTIQYTPPSPTKTVGILWWSGTRWIKLGQGVVDTAINTVSFQTALPGTYQLRQYEASTELVLDRANVFPRIFSPNGDNLNDFVYFVVENPQSSPLEGTIYALSGGEVASLEFAGAGAPTPSTLVWDGKDRAEETVPAGVYLYEIRGEGKIIQGTVIVAK
jgi:hypothetical protein